jgi:hypothetical protein
LFQAYASLRSLCVT